MLKTLDALLIYIIKILDKGNEEITNLALGNPIENLSESEINLDETCVIQDTPDDYHNHNSSIPNINVDAQKQIVLKLRSIVEKVVEEDRQLQEDIKIHSCDDIHSELRNIVHTKIKSDPLLQLEIIQLMIENFELLILHEIECKSEFIEFLSENNEILSSEILTKQIFHKVLQLKNVFNNVSDLTLELIRQPSQTIKSFVRRIGMQSNKPWVDRVSEGELSTAISSKSFVI